MNRTTCSLTALFAMSAAVHVARAQIAGDNPSCLKDPVRGIVCVGSPPVTVTRELPFKFSLFGETGSVRGFQAGARYDHELRGTDHLAHASLAFGSVTSGARTRNIAAAEIIGTFAMDRSYRPVVGLRHSSGSEITRAVTLITGVRTGRAQTFATASIESGTIQNRNSGDRGFETTVAVTGYRNLPFAEVDAALRAGMAWSAGGPLAGASIGLSRSLGSQMRLRFEWNRERLSARAGNAGAASTQLRFGMSLAAFGSTTYHRKSGAVATVAASPDDDGLSTRNDRDEFLARSAILLDSGVAMKNVFEGAPPGQKGGFGFREKVECDYNDDGSTGGNTPKFICTNADGDKLKVKYGCDNGEVFGEVAATRLLWLLGFSADRMYPVEVHCRNCPPLPHFTVEENTSGHFECAAIERKSGEAIESVRDGGWSWDELDKVSAPAGGATRAEVDALKLVAVLLQHNDSKSSNQRITCSEDSWSAKSSAGKICLSPRLMIHDVGATFGGAGNRVRDDSSVDLVHWREQMIWRDGARCVANLAGSTNGGTIFDPAVSEAGRALLATLLQNVTAAQIHDLFRVAQVPLHYPGPSIADWESAFWYKAYQIVNHRCAA